MLVKIAVWIEPWVSSKLVTWVCDKVCDNVTDSTDELILFSFHLQSFNNKKKCSYNSFKTVFRFDQKRCACKNTAYQIWVILYESDYFFNTLWFNQIHAIIPPKTMSSIKLNYGRLLKKYEVFCDECQWRPNRCP